MMMLRLMATLLVFLFSSCATKSSDKRSQTDSESKDKPSEGNNETREPLANLSAKDAADVVWKAIQSNDDNAYVVDSTVDPKNEIKYFFEKKDNDFYLQHRVDRYFNLQGTVNFAEKGWEATRTEMTVMPSIDHLSKINLLSCQVFVSVNSHEIANGSHTSGTSSSLLLQ